MLYNILKRLHESIITNLAVCTFLILSIIILIMKQYDLFPIEHWVITLSGVGLIITIIHGLVGGILHMADNLPYSDEYEGAE